MELPSVGGKKALLVIATQNFRDEEYFDTKQVLEEQGAVTTTAGRETGESTGMLGKKASIEVAISDVKADDYDAVVFIGGSGASEYFNDSNAHEIAVSAYEKGKVVAAICIAPVTLANAGLLKGKRATSWGGEFASQVEAGGAEHTGENVVRDRTIITANGPAAAREFGSEIVMALAGR